MCFFFFHFHLFTYRLNLNYDGQNLLFTLSHKIIWFHVIEECWRDLIAGNKCWIWSFTHDSMLCFSVDWLILFNFHVVRLNFRLTRWTFRSLWDDVDEDNHFMGNLGVSETVVNWKLQVWKHPKAPIFKGSAIFFPVIPASVSQCCLDHAVWGDIYQTKILCSTGKKSMLLLLI